MLRDGSSLIGELWTLRSLARTHSDAAGFHRNVAYAVAAGACSGACAVADKEYAEAQTITIAYEARIERLEAAKAIMKQSAARGVDYGSKDTSVC